MPAAVTQLGVWGDVLQEGFYTPCAHLSPGKQSHSQETVGPREQVLPGVSGLRTDGWLALIHPPPGVVVVLWPEEGRSE